MSGNPIKIMYVIGSMGHGRAGTERNLLTIVENLDRSRFQPYLVSLQDCEYLQRRQFICDTSCLDLYRMFTPAMFAKRRQLAQRMRELGIDIVQTFFVEGHLVGGGAGEIAGVKVIISSRRNLGYSYSWKERLLLRIANRYPHRWLANSQAVADSISRLEHTDRSRFDVIYNGVSIPLSVEKTPSEGPQIAIVANLRPVKSIDTFIRAAAIVRDSLPAARFLVIGDGPLRASLEDLVASLSLQDTVSFLGSTPDVHAALVGATVGVLTSSSEGFSNAILEYMCAGLPVIATDIGGNREAVVDGSTGFLIPVGDHSILAQRLLHLLTNPAETRRLGQAGRQRVEQQFSLQAMIRNHQDYYSKLISR